MSYQGPPHHDAGIRSPRRGVRGVLGRLMDVAIDDVLGEMTWMFVLALSVLLFVGLVWLFTNIFA